jgi:cbb3-type cytochrome oxidase subunit 3
MFNLAPEILIAAVGVIIITIILVGLVLVVYQRFGKATENQ